MKLIRKFTGDPRRQETSYDILTGKNNIYYSYDGDVTVTGTMNLAFTEPFTNTKIWVKSLKTDPISFKVKSYSQYTGPNIPNTDPLVWNTLSTELDKVYNKTLQTVWNHLEPAELLQKKTESAEIKKNSGFIKD